ncbi:MAG: sialate O-acetylesterase [Oscillospiraceae bacterium]|nr:sialate O-acetylesterase [Oscillospiraceae bacterium]
MSAFSTAAVFSSNMVLQRGRTVCVFGCGEDGAEVCAEIDGAKRTAVVRNGRWSLKLPPHKAARGLTLTVSCGSEARSFDNVAYGEVWLAGGQSNMELELGNCREKDALQNDRQPDVRYYYTNKKTLKEDDFFEEERKSCWKEFSPDNAFCWSAVGYFFAKELAAKLGVVVGVIGCNWGGTSASHWMSRESLERDGDLREYLDDLDRATAGKTDEEMKKEWLEYQAYDSAWYQKSLVFYKEHPNGSWDECQEYCGKNLYPGPLSPYNPLSPTALYHSMIQRICPYTLAGFIYYQGESDDHRPHTYYKLFRELIRLWRDDWGDDRLPFLFVQLPMHRYEADEDRKNWCVIREAQMKVFNTVKNTGIAVALDKGEFNEIHPKSKEPVGHRLALQALYHVYGFDNLKETAFSPMYKEYEIVDGGILLSFDHCYGFRVEGELCGFEIAGADMRFVPADAEFRGEQIFVSSREVAEPLYARYNWTNYGDVAVFGVNGLPLAPFRTVYGKE